jgi:hypothetical protein
MEITVDSREETELPWPDYGNAVGAKLSEDLYGFTFGDICHNAGCMLGTSLVFNIDTLRRQIQDDSNATTLEGTQEFIASMIDNTLINRLLTRLVSNAPEPTLGVPVAIGVPSVQFGDYKYVRIVCILNGVIALAYIAEFVRTSAWKATPPFDIMNDSDVIVAAFEGARAFEKSFKPTSAPHNYNKRLSTKAMLNLQYDDSQLGKPILLPHSTSLAYTSVPAEEHPGVDSFTPSLEHIPLVERRLL